MALERVTELEVHLVDVLSWQDLLELKLDGAHPGLFIRQPVSHPLDSWSDLAQALVESQPESLVGDV